MTPLPSRQQILWALQHLDGDNIEDMVKASDILRPLSCHPDWSSALVNHRCPLCGYETTATNVHRSCPDNPTEHAVPMYVVEKHNYEELEDRAIRSKKKSRRTTKGTFHGKSRGKYKGRDF